MKTSLASTIRISLILAAAAACKSPGSEASLKLDGTADDGRNSAVVLLANVVGDSISNYCTGTFVSAHVLVAAAHCFIGEPTTDKREIDIERERSGGQNWFWSKSLTNVKPVGVAQRVFVNPDWFEPNDQKSSDLAIAVFNGEAAPSTVSLLHRPAQVGDAGEVLGYGATFDEDVGPKRWKNVKVKTATNDMVQVSGVRLEGGDSGGPVLIDGKLAAVLATFSQATPLFSPQSLKTLQYAASQGAAIGGLSQLVACVSSGGSGCGEAPGAGLSKGCIDRKDKDSCNLGGACSWNEANRLCIMTIAPSGFDSGNVNNQTACIDRRTKASCGLAGGCTWSEADGLCIMNVRPSP